jgi:hypothetical protein
VYESQGFSDSLDIHFPGLITVAKEAFMDTRLTPLEKTEKPIGMAAEVVRLAR